MPEQLDIYDDALQHLGTKPRPAVHRDGDWHRVFHAWVIYRDATHGAGVILQKRATTKATFPDYLDVSAAGHYAAGETVRDGVRELHEELGVAITFDALIPAGRRVSMARYGDLIDREVADVFFCVHQQALSDYAYQRDEVAGLVAVPIDDGLRLWGRDVDAINVPAVGLGTTTVTVSREDFIPTLDHYFYKVLLLAHRCLDGARPLLV
jgi:isopentenyldiphosphate isomerase